jgi:hypothetical protein
MALLATMPGTCVQLGVVAKVPSSTVRRLMPKMHKAGEIHIIDFENASHTNQPVPIWQAGPGVDVKSKFKPKTPRQYYRKYFKKLKESGEIEHRRAAARARRNAKAILKRPAATWFSSLPGAAA